MSAKDRATFRIFALLTGILLLMLLAACVPPTPTPQPTPPPTEELRFYGDDGAPLANETLRILCFPGQDPANPTPDAATGKPYSDITTDAEGRPSPPLADKSCAYIAAMRLIHAEPSGKPDRPPDFANAFEIYATSWDPAKPLPQAARGKILVSEKQPLVLFNVLADLEWQPAGKSTFVRELAAGLAEASRYLYDLSEGQMAFGRVGIRSGGRGWDASDLRFKAANDYRPSAFIGGIVKAPVTGDMRYLPAEVFLGRYWDGKTAAIGSWNGSDAARTITHEWAHYALLLGDEYLKWADLNGDGVWDMALPSFCTCTDLPLVSSGSASICGGVDETMAASAMSYHYTASELWYEASPGAPPPQCDDTDQLLLHGENDWDALARWGDELGLGGFSGLQKPSGIVAGPPYTLARHFWDLSVIDAPTDPNFSEPTVALALAPGGAAEKVPVQDIYPQVYTLHGGDDVLPKRILYQGTGSGEKRTWPGLGEITLFGIEKDARARAFAESYSSERGVLGRFRYPGLGGDVPLTPGQTLILEPDEWQASLDILLSCGEKELKFDTLNAVLTTAKPLPDPPLAQLCSPDAAVGCGLMGTVNGGGDRWEIEFRAPAGQELPHYGIIRVFAKEGGELIRWYQMQGGVGPAHSEGDAPLRDGMVAVDPAEPLPGGNSRVLVMPSADFAAVSQGLPDGVDGILGSPFDVDILQFDPEQPGACLGAKPGDHQLSTQALLTFFYPQDELDRRGLDESQLVMLKFVRDDERGGNWEILPTAPRDEILKQWDLGEVQRVRQTLQEEGAPDNTWLTTSPIENDGIFLIGYRR